MTQNPLPSSRDTEPTFGERLSISFAVAGAWLVGGFFLALFLFFGLPAAQGDYTIFLAITFGYLALGLFAVAYVFINPRREKA